MDLLEMEKEGVWGLYRTHTSSSSPRRFPEPIWLQKIWLAEARSELAEIAKKKKKKKKI
jgi:hypothetical protein